MEILFPSQCCPCRKARSGPDCGGTHCSFRTCWYSMMGHHTLIHPFPLAQPKDTRMKPLFKAHDHHQLSLSLPSQLSAHPTTPPPCCSCSYIPPGCRTTSFLNLTFTSNPRLTYSHSSSAAPSTPSGPKWHDAATYCKL